MYCPFGKTEDGFETQFGVNHLGHFLLTNLLLKKIEQAPKGRIIIVSSIGHAYASKLDLDTINSEAHYSPYDVYHKSKVANVLFAKALAKRLWRTGTDVTVNSLHPGAVDTELARHSIVVMVSIYVTVTLAILIQACMHEFTKINDGYNTGENSEMDNWNSRILEQWTSLFLKIISSYSL